MRSGTVAEDSAPSLRVVDVSMTFGLARVLRGASLELAPGEVHALVGENGSGKSTLVKILAGYHVPDSGSRVEVDGETLEFGEPRSSADLGLRFVHQDLGLVGTLDTVENLGLGSDRSGSALAPFNRRRERVEAREALQKLGYDIDVTLPVNELTASERTAIAVARAISPRRSRTRVLIVDEPTANLPAPEVDRLFDLMRRVAADGIAILFISHHFNEIFELADRATVLRNGRIVETRSVSELDEDALVELMMGRALTRVSHTTSAGVAAGDPALVLSGVSGAAVDSFDLEIAPGEVVGIAGITGSGREELAGLLGGDTPRKGTVSLSGENLPAERPDLFIKRGGAYLPASRAQNAVLAGHSILENMTISRLRPYFSKGRWNTKQERADVDELITDLDVRPPVAGADIATLSGGNQQKVMLARSIRLRPRAYVLDEPTQGVDVGAQAEIHRIIREQARAGAAILICSSSNEELAEVADRVLVLREGKVAASFTAPIDPDQVTVTMLSTTKENNHVY